MKQVILTKGLPASGKTTWAKQQLAKHPGQYKRINKDDLRAMLDAGKWSKGNERFVLDARDALILAALQSGYHVIVDDTNLHSKHEVRIRDLVRAVAEVRIEDFTHVSVDECIERDRKRPNYVGERVIRRMYRDHLAAKPEIPAYDETLPDAIICDLDGTLAHMDGRGPFEWARVGEDRLDAVIADHLRMVAIGPQVRDILLVSGRSDECRAETEAWLERHNVPYFELHMRPAGDMRKDSIIKRELYEAQIRGRFNVLYVLDDRDQVVETWRALGLVCWQVAPGDF